ncbi:L-rhamnose mutarotase [Mucilaginibacter sp. FT3.2]|uniref:L-rhamnose mutarotase n=1 Tax=Mucilaginibacter sp. FT3.2 TaxID=2723090 RepID=UPI00180C9B08|nr:L-rhamnose mutarotase [Mucilaginibacter sp. FT3.2]MBB6230283.1 L-rhamnose mutarotase [Mucilaginibacter sp. FT3.2]
MFGKINPVTLISVIAFVCCAYLLVSNVKQHNQLMLQKNSAFKLPPVQRFGMVTGLKPEKVAYYKQLHAHVWPGVLKKIKECNIRNYSIYIQKIEGKYFLFSYFEYAGNNMKADMAKMAADTTTQRWWKETDPTQNPLPEALAQKKQWQNMEEVFHTN